VRAVVVSAWAPWWLTDGAVWILHHQLQWLAHRHDVTVLAAGAPVPECPVPVDAAEAAAPAMVRWFGRGTPAAVDYLRRRVGAWSSGEPAHVGYVERPALIDALRAEIARARPDVVHAFGWGTAGMWRYADGVPVVHVAVDAWHRNASNRLLPAWRRITDTGELRRIRAHEARHYPQDAAVVVVAEPDAAAVHDVAASARVEVVPNGVDAGPTPTQPPATPVLGFHGSFDAAHNADAARVLVEDVLPQVRAAVPDARVLLVGRRPGGAVRRLCGPHVELRADVADARAELRDVAVYVAPLVSGSGLKNKVLEAMAASRPVVTTPLGAAGIGAGDGVLVRDVSDIAADVIALLTDRDRLSREGMAGRERVTSEFTWERSAQRIETLWQDVVP
jgi:glycosyltransferase involved in cell wall biosynthesis